MQIKTTMKYHLTSVRTAIIQKSINNKYRGVCGGKGALLPDGGNVNWCTHMETVWVQFSSVAQSCLTLCNFIDCSMPGLPVHQELPELAQTHVHRVGDAILPSHPLLSPSPPVFNLSQQQGLFQWVNSLHEVAKLLEFSASASFPPKKSQGWYMH